MRGTNEQSTKFGPSNVWCTAGPYAELVGRFLCPVSRVGDLRASLDGRVEGELVVGLVCDTGVEALPEAVAAVEADARLVLGAVEARLPADATDLAAATEDLIEWLPGTEAYVELPGSPGWPAALAVLADSPYGAKLRTGGAEAAAFPTDAEVARFVEACVVDEVPFKCTAGLHHAVRHTDPATGFEHHGFLNLLLATEAAAHGTPLDQVEHVVAERDPARLLRHLEQLDDTDAAVTRSFFVAFGSCSVDEPVADLRAWGLLQ